MSLSDRANREYRLQQRIEHLYTYTFQQIGEVTTGENEIRYFTLELVKKLIEGIGLSLGIELQREDLRKEQELRTDPYSRTLKHPHD